MMCTYRTAKFKDTVSTCGAATCDVVSLGANWEKEKTDPLKRMLRKLKHIEQLNESNAEAVTPATTKTVRDARTAFCKS